MIKRSVFEDDLIAGMQRNLAESELQEGIESLPKAADYINSAIDIFEELGMYSKADAAIKVLEKIAASVMPSLQAITDLLRDYKLSLSDIRTLSAPTTDENIAIKARLSAVLRKLDKSGKSVEKFFNISLLSDDDIINYYKSEVKPHKELELGDDPKIISIAKHKKSLHNSKKITDRHSPKNSEEAVRNLLQNGTVFKFIFNDSNKSDDDSVEDVFDADVNDLEEEDPTQDLDESFEEE